MVTLPSLSRYNRRMCLTRMLLGPLIRSWGTRLVSPTLTLLHEPMAVAARSWPSRCGCLALPGCSHVSVRGPQASSFSPACGRVPSICRADLVLASLTTPLSILHGAVRIVQPCHSLALNCCVLEHSRVWEGDLVHAPHIREHPSRV